MKGVSLKMFNERINSRYQKSDYNASKNDNTENLRTRVVKM